jgi:acetyl esterase/lipase
MVPKLRAFLVALEEESLNRAALRLRMSQSELSRQMQVLENQIGGALLERTAAGVRPTDAGYALATSLPVSSPTTMRQLRKRGASPLNYVHRDEPPILVIRGTSDKLVPYQQAQELTAAMDKVGAPYHFHTVVGGGHNPYFGLAVNPKASNFNLGGGGIAWAPPNVLRQFLSHGSRNSFLGSLARC